MGMHSRGEQVFIRKLSSPSGFASLFPVDKVLRCDETRIASDHFQGEHPHLTRFSVYIRLTLREGATSQFHLSAEQVLSRLVYLEKIGGNAVGGRFIEGRVLQIIKRLVALKTHAGVVYQVGADPTILMQILGMV